METSRVYTGIKEIDDATTIVPSGIVIINARPGVGKTSLMLNMLQNACYASEESNSPVLYSADMTEDEFYTKMMSKALRMTPDEVYDIQKNPAYTDIRQKGDDEVERIFGKARICYDKRLSVDRIRDDLNALREAGALPKTIFIDYVQKLVGCEDYGSGVQNLIELKALQGEFKINMILLSQIPRLGGDEETPVLTAAAAKGGSIYEETASIIMNMWRPMKHCPDNLHDDTLAIYIAKNRMGSCPPTIYLHFNGAHSEIRSKTPDELGIFKVNHAAYKEAKEEVKGPKRGKFR
jgi:replicative DNA helicase